MNDEPQKSNAPELDVKSEVIDAIEPTGDKSKKSPRKRRSKPARKTRSRDKSKEKKGVGFLTVFVMMVIATIGGAVLSQLYNQFGPPHEQTVTTAQIQALEAKIAALPKPEVVDLAPFDARIKALEARPDVVLGDENVGLEGIPADMETRLAALERNNPSDIEVLIARLTALETKSEPVPSVTTETDNINAEVLTARIEALENSQDMAELEARLTELETQGEAPQEIAPELLQRLNALETALQTVPDPVDLSSVEARVAALETEAQNIKTTQADVLKATTPIPPFPSEAVLKALENTKTSSDKGWLGKTFDKYVLADNAEAIKTVSRVESLLQQGRVDMALEQVENLPAPAQAAAQDWIEAVKAKRR